ncbi:hypothetical protein [Microbulbifer sp. 2205BS26-8]|uniref:hypothetical protein n=1 Tax=Microbulbifer sp. 2205BS26-8 TaxID=3064386 RepID=UPI0027402780|nr:hypothetical protein [Microbulbifer sp. 2205BS26-8]MDP5211296.1 hypothetical protein [Microbulbifer sp. 2205BS26-8]
MKVLPQSPLPQDGGAFYFGRSIVPDDSKENAINRLTSALEEDFMLIEKVSRAVTYDSQQWNSEADEDFEINESHEEAKQKGEVKAPLFVRINH